MRGGDAGKLEYVTHRDKKMAAQAFNFRLTWLTLPSQQTSCLCAFTLFVTPLFVVYCLSFNWLVLKHLQIPLEPWRRWWLLPSEVLNPVFSPRKLSKCSRQRPYNPGSFAAVRKPYPHCPDSLFKKPIMVGARLFCVA